MGQWIEDASVIRDDHSYRSSLRHPSVRNDSLLRHTVTRRLINPPSNLYGIFDFHDWTLS